MGLKRLQYWHYDFARMMAFGKHRVQLEKRWCASPWNKSKSTIKRLMNDPLIKAEVDRINVMADEQTAKSKARVKLLGDLSLDVIERELNREPWDAKENTGDIQCNPIKQAKLAMDLLKELNLGNKAIEDGGKITVIFADAEEEKPPEDLAAKEVEEFDESTLEEIDDEKTDDSDSV